MMLHEIVSVSMNCFSREYHMGKQLSGEEQQMLAIGRALSTNPKLLILDEATEGLAPVVREEIWRCLAQLREKGQTSLIVDKYIEKIKKITDSFVIFKNGLSTNLVDKEIILNYL